MKQRLFLPVFLLLAACGPGKDALLHETVAFVYGEWNPALAKELLANGADVNSRDNNGRTPLHNTHGIGCDYHEDQADYADAEEALRLLLSAGADVHALTPQGHNALDLALCRYDNANLVEILRAAGLRPTKPEYELVWYARHNEASKVRRLLAQGVSPNAVSAEGETALWATMPCINLKPHAAECMRLLLATGANPNTPAPHSGRFILDAATHYAAADELSSASLRLLRRYGARHSVKTF